ncbi:glycosyltransferase family 4 protein [Frigidibacter oleivorans]|uniref:glycosyltransferase family 4 protein n=1 Tax=Frigidibacter oleivorans TaxID=2487129 RepID=UPI000F8DA2E4|nr:glycosyltransferase family 4 protein [Frigidibacter oleivorans]
MTRRPPGAAPSVLFVVPAFHPNLYYATRGLARAGIRVHVFAQSQDDHTPATHVALRRFGPDPGWRDLSRALDAAAPDLVLIRDASPLSRRASMLARLKGLAMIGYDIKPLSRRSPPRLLLQKALRGQPPRRVTPVRLPPPAPPADPWAFFLPLPVGIYDDPPPPRPAGDRLRVLAVAKLAQPRKRVPQLIEELAPAGQAGRIALTVVGSTTLAASRAEAAILDRVRDLSAGAEWLTLLEDRPFPEMPAIHAAHDVCVLPSTGEPLGIAPLEGMAYGTVPVISTGAGSAGMIRAGENGLTVDVQQPGRIAAAIDRLAADPALLARLRAGALATVADELSETAYVAAIRALIASRGRRIAP